MEDILKQKTIDDGNYFYKQIMRQQRNQLLKDTDKYLLSDFPIKIDDLTIIKDYRQQLRDISKNNFILPNQPDFIN